MISKNKIKKINDILVNLVDMQKMSKENEDALKISNEKIEMLEEERKTSTRRLILYSNTIRKLLDEKKLEDSLKDVEENMMKKELNKNQERVEKDGEQEQKNS